MKIALAAGLAVLGAASTAWAQSIGKAGDTLGSTAPSAAGSLSSLLTGESSAKASSTSLASGQQKLADNLKQINAEQVKVALTIQTFATVPANQQAATVAGLKQAAAALDQSLAKSSKDPQFQNYMTTGDATTQATLQKSFKTALAQQQQLDAVVAQLAAGKAPVNSTASTPSQTLAATQTAMQNAVQTIQNTIQNGEAAGKPAAPSSASSETSAAMQQALQAAAAAMQAAAAAQKPGSSAGAPPAGTQQQVLAALAQLQKSQQSLVQLEKGYPQLSASQKTASIQQMSAAIVLNDQILQAMGQQAALKAMSTASAQDQKSFAASLQDSMKTESALETNMKSLGSAPTGEQTKPSQPTLQTPQTSQPTLQAAKPVVDAAGLLKQQQAAAAAAQAQNARNAAESTTLNAQAAAQQAAGAAQAAAAKKQQQAQAASAAAAAAAHTNPPVSKPAPVIAAATPVKAPQKPSGPSPLVKKHKDALAKIKAQQAELAKRNQAFAKLSAAQQQESLKTMMEQSAAIDKAHADMQKEILQAYGQITKEEQQSLKESLKDSMSQQQEILAMLKEMQQMASKMGRP